MFIALFLIILFTILIIAEIYFLGKYISITQEIFLNKNFLVLVMGFVVYFFITFLLFLPTYFFLINIYYLVTIFIFKDFFLISFLVSRSKIFKGVKFNFKLISITFIMVILLTIFNNYIFSKFQIVERNYKNSFVLNLFVRVLAKISISNENIVFKIMIQPLFSLLALSTIFSFWFFISKKDNWFNYLLSFLLVVSLMLLFNFNKSFELVALSFLLLFLVQVGYYLIIYSRRRYGILSGITTMSLWGLEETLFWAMMGIVVSVFVIYTLLRKPKASFFTVQLLSPLLILSALWIKDYSKIMTIIIIVFTSIFYALIFFFGRYQFIEKNIWLMRFNYFWPFLIFLTLVIYSSIEFFTSLNMRSDIFIQEKNIFFDFNNKTFNKIGNFGYYFVAAILIFYILYMIIFKKKIVGVNLIITIIFAIFVFAFNPFFQIALKSEIKVLYFNNICFIAIAPLIIIGFFKFSSWTKHFLKNVWNLSKKTLN